MTEEGDRHKGERQTAKHVLTKELQTFTRLMAERELAQVQQRLQKLKDKFSNFEASHDSLIPLLNNAKAAKDLEKDFSETLKLYVDSMNNIHHWLDEHDKHSAVKSTVVPEISNTARVSNELSHVDIVNILNLPKVELEPYDGDPLKYYGFLAIFDENVDSIAHDGRIKLTRLLQYTCGKAKDAIRSCALVGGDEGYKQAREILRKRFGNDHLISAKIIQNFRNNTPVKSAEQLQQLADDLLTGYTTLNNMGKLGEVNSQSFIAEVSDRLQPHLKNRWRKVALEKKRDDNQYPDFKTFTEFIIQQADEASDPVYGENSSVQSQDKKSISTFNTVTRSSVTSSSTPCVVCHENHHLFYCKEFKSMKPVERYKIVKSQKLCENCLYDNHDVSSCKRPTVCTVPQCGQKHTKFIHLSQDTVAELNANEVVSNQVKLVNANFGDSSDVHVPTVPVIVNGIYSTSALLDTASTSSFCSRKLVDYLQLQGSAVDVSINTLSHVNDVRQVQVVDFTLKSRNGESTLSMSNVYVVDEIPVMASNANFEMYPHLQDLPLFSGKPVDILIGQNHSDALIPLDVRRGAKGEPFAVRTMLGWSVNGPAVNSNFVPSGTVSHVVSVTTIDVDWHDQLVDDLPSQDCDIYVSGLTDSSVQTCNTPRSNVLCCKLEDYARLRHEPLSGGHGVQCSESQIFAFMVTCLFTVVALLVSTCASMCIDSCSVAYLVAVSNYVQYCLYSFIYKLVRDCDFDFSDVTAKLKTASVWPLDIRFGIGT